MSCECYPANDLCPSEAFCGSGTRAVAVQGEGHPGYLELLDEIRELHLVKSGGYGTGDDPFSNFSRVADTTGQPRFVYPIHRSLEKHERMVSLLAQGRLDELEEEFLDCASLMLCAAAMLREDR